MKYHTIKLYLPEKGFSISKIPKKESIYDSIDFFRDNFCSKSEFEKQQNKNIELRKILNLHNEDGIKSMPQITSMIKQLKLGEEVLESSRIPNIKLAKIKKGQFILFDGHHTLLAYMFVGKKNLDQVPHIVVETGESMSNEEILDFFLEHKSKIKGSEWTNFVINWQASVEKQICPRIQKNMGELFDSIKKLISLDILKH